MSPIISAISAAPSRRLAARLPFYYGWVMLPIAMLAMIATSPGQTFGISIFNPSFRLALGLSHSQLTGAYMAGTLLAALPQPYIGGLMDRFGIRRVMFIIVIMLGMACIFMSQVSNLLMLFLAFFCLRLLGQGALSLLANNTLAMWFQVRLGTVMGMMSAAVAGAIALIPPLILLLINQFGWRGAFAVLGVIVWIIMLPILLFLYQNRPQDVGQSLDGRSSTETEVAIEEKEEALSFTLREARHTRAYWILLLFTAAWALIITAVYFNIIPIFTNQGLTDVNAAATFTTIAVVMGVTQLIGGALADRFRLSWLAFLCMLFIASGVWMLSRADSVALAQLYAVLIGMGQGLFGAVNNTVWVRYYGRAHLGRIRGSVAVAMVAGSSTGPFIMGATYDLFGSYQVSLNLFIALLLTLAIATLWATPPVLSTDEATVASAPGA
ncbi:MAG: MFS transporter [Anaerolineaceae bacterium]|nr:MAG: MFS transporter [Anaerolineaceae bacterium]